MIALVMDKALVAMNLVGWILAIAIAIALLVWAIPHRGPAQRCPNCGANLDSHPHKPRCKYWRD